MSQLNNLLKMKICPGITNLSIVDPLCKKIKICSLQAIVMKTIGAEISVNPVFPKKSTSQDSHQQHPNKPNTDQGCP